MNKEDNTSEDLMQDLWDEDSPLSDPPTDPDLAGTPQTMDDDWIDEGVNAITPSEIIEIVLDTGDSGIIDLGEFNAPDTKTEDFEIFADVDDFDEDIFVKTGITFINIETGDLIQTEDFPDRPSVGLKIHDDPNIPLPGPWAQFMTELRDETLAEPDPRKRGAYLYVFSRLATFFGQSAQRVVRPLAELAQVSGAALRSDLLLQLAFSWDRADDTFLTLLNRLERIDSSDEGALSSVRRSSIAMERLLCGGVSDEFRVQLRDVIIPPETFPGLLVLSADAHAAKDPVAASRSWIRLTNYTKGQLQSAVHSVVAYFLQSSPRFHPELEDLLSRPNARALLLIAQREAKRRGDRAREIDAVRKLISQDVAAGKKMASAAAEKDRLKAETGARLHQLSNLLRNSDAEAERQSPYDVLRDAIRLNPTNRVVLREMIRNAIDREDFEDAQKNLERLIATTTEPSERAILYEQSAYLLGVQGKPATEVERRLKQSLATAPDCLPALISMGQHLIVQGDYPEMMYLRGGTEARDFQAAWRNAELMERTGSPVESFSAAYHDARDGNPNNPHLFFCVERSLCRAGNWTDLISLYEAGNARNSELAAIFERANFDVHPYRTATQVFLAPTKRQEFMVDLEEWIGRADGEFDGAFWQLIGHEFATDPGRALGRLEILKQHDQDAPPSRALRTNLWYAQLVGKKLGQTKKLGEIFAAMLNDASSPLAKRYAARGLVAEQRYEELAAFTASNPKNARWLVDADSEMTHHALAAELYALAGDFKKALEYLWSVASKATNDRELAEASERAIALSLRNNHWKGVLPFLPTIFGTEHHRTIAGLVRHIAAALDDAEESLERIDTAKIESKDDPNTLLSEIELAYRARDFSRLVALLQRSLRTLAAGSIDFRSFILEQGVLVSEWSDPKASGAFLDDLLALQKNARSTPVFTLAAQFRHAARTSKRKKTSIKALTKKAKELFTPAIVETLAEEARVVEEATTGEEAAAWYAARAPDVPEQIRPYYRFMASFLMWTFGDRSRTNVQEFADAVSLGDPSHQIGDFLLAIAYRDAGLQDLAERQLKSIFSAHCEPVRDWAAVRQFFHLAVTGGETELALNELNESDEFRSYPWYETLRELFQRALRREDAIDALRRRAKVAPGRRMVALEIAELENDLDALKKLEAVGLVSAKFRVFIRAVQDNVYTADDVEGLYADVADAMTTGAEDADDLFSNYVSTVDRTFIGTPWCPIALWERHAGKSDVQLVKDHVRQLEATLTRVDDEMANEARLFVAKRYAEIGVSDASTRLAPRTIGNDLASFAWDVFQYSAYTPTLAAVSGDHRFWQRRAQICNEELGGEIEYELGRCLTLMDDSNGALQHFRSALSYNASFLPAQVAAGRLLIQNRNWNGLSTLWEAELANVEDEQLIASLSFRIGFLYLRRMRGPEAMRIATEHFQRTLRVRPNHLPSIENLLAIGYRSNDYSLVAKQLERLVSIVPDSSPKADRYVELGLVRERALQNPAAAAEAFKAALEIEPTRSDAFFGLLRTDLDGDLSIDVMLQRLDSGVTPREAADIGSELFALNRFNPKATSALEERFPNHLAWRIAQLAEGVERGVFEKSAAHALRSVRDDDINRLVDIFERTIEPSFPTRDDQVGIHPLSEGKLVALMALGNEKRDLKLLADLAVARARRSANPLLRAAELTWMLCVQYEHGAKKDALYACEQLLTQYGEFGPAVKLAKLFAEETEQWHSVVRWYGRDAELTRCPEIISANRVRVSAVQREHLKDADAALEELRRVLTREPAHKEAFGQIREVLLSRGDHGELLTHYEAKLDATSNETKQRNLLNEMADISMTHLRDPNGAMRLLRRSLEIDPNQLRRVRVLADLLESGGRIEASLEWHESAARLTEDKTLKPKIWKHIGRLLEHRLNKANDANNAYRKALKFEPQATHLWMDVARTCEKSNLFEDAIHAYQTAISFSRDERLLLDARVGVARAKKKRGDQPTSVLEAIREVLIHHPTHTASIEAAQAELRRYTDPDQGRADGFFGAIITDTLSRDPARGLQAAFEIANKLKQYDRAYCLAGMGRASGTASQSMWNFHENRSVKRRWPAQPIPREEATGLLPAELVSGTFLELLRALREGVMVGMEKSPLHSKATRQSRVKDSDILALRLAERWPLYYNLESAGLFVGGGIGNCAVLQDGAAVKVLVDIRWNTNVEPTPLLIDLGRKLAAYSMALSPWDQLDRDAQCSLLISIIAKYVPGWNHVPRKHLPSNIDLIKIHRWLEKQDRRVAAFALEVSGRYGAPAIREQFTLMHNALERFACVTIDDPAHALQHASFDEASGEQIPGMFYLSPASTRIRRALGLSVDS